VQGKLREAQHGNLLLPRSKMTIPTSSFKRVLLSSYPPITSRLAYRAFLRFKVHRSQATQAVPAPVDRKTVIADIRTEHNLLNDVFQLLRTKPISWNNSGPAEFDFRSMTAPIV